MEQPVQPTTGVQATKAVILFLASLGAAVKSAQADGKIDLADLPHLMGPIMSITPAIANAKLLPAEFKDLSLEEKNEVVAFFKEKFDLPNDKTEALVEDAFDAVLVVLTFLQKHVLK